MKLWILRPIESRKGDAGYPWKPWYNKSFGAVVAASSEAEARKLAAAEDSSEFDLGPESRHPWLESSWSSCVELRADDYAEPAYIIEDFAKG